MDKVSSSLPPQSLSTLQELYKRGPMTSEDLFEQVMGDRYQPTLPYVKMIRSIFYNDQPGDSFTTRLKISNADRERCVIAMLASRGEVRNLGVHIYVALMLDITPEEIADIIFLAGVYSGVPAVADGLDTLIQVLGMLHKLVTEPGFLKEVTQPQPRSEPDLLSVFMMLSKKLQL